MGSGRRLTGSWRRPPLTRRPRPSSSSMTTPIAGPSPRAESARLKGWPGLSASVSGRVVLCTAAALACRPGLWTHPGAPQGPGGQGRGEERQVDRQYGRGSQSRVSIDATINRKCSALEEKQWPECASVRALTVIDHHGGHGAGRALRQLMASNDLKL